MASGTWGAAYIPGRLQGGCMRFGTRIRWKDLRAGGVGDSTVMECVEYGERVDASADGDGPESRILIVAGRVWRIGGKWL